MALSYLRFVACDSRGTPNCSDTARAIPNALFSPAWSTHIVGPQTFTEDGSEVIPQMPPEVYAKLSERGQKLCKDMIKTPGPNL